MRQCIAVVRWGKAAPALAAKSKWLRVGYGGQANAEPAAGLSSPPTHGMRRNYKRTTHATAPCKDCVLGSKGEHRVEEACLPGTMVQQPASRSLRSANARCSASLLGEYDGWPSRAPRAV
jgi:hypothetical protein